jgi:hypothetical protein
MKQRLNRIPLHPILAAAYPVLAQLAVNLGEAELRDGLRLFLLSLLGASVLLALLWLLLRNLHRAALFYAPWAYSYSSRTDTSIQHWKGSSFSEDPWADTGISCRFGFFSLPAHSIGCGRAGRSFRSGRR